MTLVELNRLRQECQKLTGEGQDALYGFCKNRDELIMQDLYYSLSAGVGYDSLSTIRYIPVSKRAFYRIQEKVLQDVREYLVEEGRWE